MVMTQGQIHEIKELDFSYAKIQIGDQIKLGSSDKQWNMRCEMNLHEILNKKEKLTKEELLFLMNLSDPQGL